MINCNKTDLAKKPNKQDYQAAKAPPKEEKKSVIEKFGDMFTKKTDKAKEAKTDNPFGNNFALDPEKQPLAANGLRAKGGCEHCDNCGKCGKSENKGQLANLIG